MLNFFRRRFCCVFLILYILRGQFTKTNILYFAQDLKKLLDDNHKELKSQGGSGGGLPEDLVGL